MLDLWADSLTCHAGKVRVPLLKVVAFFLFFPVPCSSTPTMAYQLPSHLPEPLSPPMLIYNNMLQTVAGPQGCLMEGSPPKSFEGNCQLFPGQHDPQMRYHPSNMTSLSAGWELLRGKHAMLYRGRHVDRKEMLNIGYQEANDEAESTIRIQEGGHLLTPDVHRTGNEGNQERLDTVPFHKQSSSPSSDIDPTICSSAFKLLEFCKRAEMEFQTWEPGTELTSRLLQPISRPAASKGPGSRRGLEAYQCLWSACGRRISKKANAISHLLSHLQYKPFLCNQW